MASLCEAGTAQSTLMLTLLSSIFVMSIGCINANFPSTNVTASESDKESRWSTLEERSSTWNCMHEHNEHKLDQCNEKRENSTTSSTTSNSAFYVTCSTQWQYDRCIDQNTSNARTSVGRRSSPTEGPVIYGSLCSTTPVCGRTFDRTYTPYCFMAIRLYGTWCRNKEYTTMQVILW
jgi:hypothetical protein